MAQAHFKLLFAVPDVAAEAVKALSACLVDIHAAQRALYKSDIESSEEARHQIGVCIDNARMARKAIEESLAAMTEVAKRGAADCDS